MVFLVDPNKQRCEVPVYLVNLYDAYTKIWQFRRASSSDDNRLAFKTRLMKPRGGSLTSRVAER